MVFLVFGMTYNFLFYPGHIGYCIRWFLDFFKPSISATICPLRFRFGFWLTFVGFSFTDSVEPLQCCVGLLHSSGDPRAPNQSQLLSSLGTESTCLVLLGYFCGGRESRSVWHESPIPCGREQVDGGLWDAAPARRSIWLLVPQLWREGWDGPMCCWAE